MPGLGQFCTKDQTAQARVPVPLGLAVLASLLLLAAAAVLQPAQASGAGGTAVTLNATRKSASDLEVGGELAGLPRGSTRYVALESLLALPQTAYTVSDDPDLPGAAKISGVPLEELAKLLAAAPDADMVVAICDDKYQAELPSRLRDGASSAAGAAREWATAAALAEESGNTWQHGAVHDFAGEIHAELQDSVA